MPPTVTSIGNSAFRGCSALGQMDIPRSVTAIGIAAFEGCWGLERLVIPSSVMTIGASAFCRLFAFDSGGRSVQRSDHRQSRLLRMFERDAGNNSITFRQISRTVSSSA
jgi:hypothetical protein